ncbi:MAG: tripartite tricarboxylate transporter substrate binding protein [Deltaproteobacteria bacterium]|jgi:putative tricarboxylic transport membrane protein|nr:tripartite tricarboxylate transporter substrate binding protein [Deltaproteobacteria bacterium]
MNKNHQIVVLFLLILTIMVFGVISQPAQAQWKPDRPVTLLVGNSAGGGADLFARAIAKVIADYKLCEQPVVVLNKPGGSHSIAYAYLREQASPYIIAVTSSSYFTVPLTGNSPVSPTDFTPIAHFSKDPNMVVLQPKSPFKTIEELVAFAKANPGKLKFAGSSNLSDDTIICELLNEQAGINIQYVPFESGSDILAALLGGHVDMGAMSPAEASEHVKNGDLRTLAVSAFDRYRDLPDVPTFKELGYDIDQQQSRAVIIEKSAPAEVVTYYSDLMKKVSQTPEWEDWLAKNGMVPMFLDSNDYKAYHQEVLEDYKVNVDKILSKNK